MPTTSPPHGSNLISSLFFSQLISSNLSVNWTRNFRSCSQTIFPQIHVCYMNIASIGPMLAQHFNHHHCSGTCLHKVPVRNGKHMPILAFSSLTSSSAIRWQREEEMISQTWILGRSWIILITLSQEVRVEEKYSQQTKNAGKQDHQISHLMSILESLQPFYPCFIYFVHRPPLPVAMF